MILCRCESPSLSRRLALKVLSHICITDQLPIKYPSPIIKWNHTRNWHLVYVLFPLPLAIPPCLDCYMFEQMRLFGALNACKDNDRRMNETTGHHHSAQRTPAQSPPRSQFFLAMAKGCAMNRRLSSAAVASSQGDDDDDIEVKPFKKPPFLNIALHSIIPSERKGSKFVDVVCTQPSFFRTKQKETVQRRTEE